MCYVHQIEFSEELCSGGNKHEAERTSGSKLLYASHDNVCKQHRKYKDITTKWNCNKITKKSQWNHKGTTMIDTELHRNDSKKQRKQRKLQWNYIKYKVNTINILVLGFSPYHPQLSVRHICPSVCQWVSLSMSLSVNESGWLWYSWPSLLYSWLSTGQAWMVQPAPRFKEQVNERVLMKRSE